MTDILKIDEKWSVQFDPENNDCPIYWLRHEDRHSPFDYNNAVTAMFYALLEARSDLATVPAQVKVLAMRDAGYDTPTDPCDAVIARLVEAAEALGAMPEGYCFCSAHRIGDDSKVHEPECADLRAAIAAVKGGDA